jgi:hypothetical protein
VESSKTLCPVCRQEAHAFVLNSDRLESLWRQLLPGATLPSYADAVAYWCLGCLVPYLVIHPDADNVNAALHMAGFPPKGGVL